jgi:hypothetical protein
MYVCIHICVCIYIYMYVSILNIKIYNDIYHIYIQYIISIYPMEFKNHLNGNTCGHYPPVMKTSIHHL